MQNIRSIEDYLASTTSISPSTIARKWRRVGYRIKGKVANIIAAKNGKKHLREGTEERLRKEIIEDLAFIAGEKKSLSQYPHMLEEVLRGVSRQEQLWKQRGLHHPKPYNREAILYLLQIRSTPSELEFVEEFLSGIMKIRRQVIEGIIIDDHLHSLHNPKKNIGTQELK